MKSFHSERATEALERLMQSQALLVYGGAQYRNWLSSLQHAITQKFSKLTMEEQHYILCWFQVLGYEVNEQRELIREGLLSGLVNEDKEAAQILNHFPLNAARDYFERIAKAKGLDFSVLDSAARTLLACDDCSPRSVPTTWLINLSLQVFLNSHPLALIRLLSWCFSQGWLKSGKFAGQFLQHSEYSEVMHRLALSEEFLGVQVVTWFEDIMLVEGDNFHGRFGKLDVSKQLFSTQLGHRVLRCFELYAQKDMPAVVHTPNNTAPALDFLNYLPNLKTFCWLRTSESGKRFNVGKIVSICAAMSLEVARPMFETREIPWFHDTSFVKPSFVSEFSKKFKSLGVNLTPETLYKSHLALMKRIETEYADTQLAHQIQFLYPYQPWYELH